MSSKLFHLVFARYKPAARSRSVLQSPGTEDERAAFRRWDAATQPSWDYRCYVPCHIMWPGPGHLPFLLGGAREPGHIIFRST
jgi:hypothetical protein